MRLLLVDDHPLMRQALRALLPARPIEIVAEAATAREAVELVELHKPALVLMDILMPGPNGIAGLRDLRRRHPKTRVLIYTALTEPSFARDALAAGADGYALKTDDAEELFRAIAEVDQGRVYLPPSMSHLMSAASTAQSTGFATLSPREREVFDLVIKGHTNDVLAGFLFISVKTIETHRSRINRKVGVHSTAQLMRFAALNGLVTS
ncbi:MAG: LuxR family transcriptional regulator [Myxococcales bacterium]|nr:LuxR family transcriptional regulator [Myxococcales bacterium]